MSVQPEALLKKLQAHRLDHLEAGDHLIFPNYGGYSLVNLPATVSHWLDAGHFGAPILAPEYLTPLKNSYQHVIILLVDGLGWEYFQTFLTETPWKEWLPSTLLLPLTSITPSTTAAALTTLWTGTAPAQHGVLGYEMWLKEYGMIGNMILHSPATFTGEAGLLRRAGFDVEQFLPVPVFAPHLIRAGVDVFAFQPLSISRSGLSTMLLSGANIVPYRTLSDLWVTLGELLPSRQQQKTYAYIYWSVLDELSHHFGPDDRRVELEMMQFGSQLKRFIAQQKNLGQGNTLFVMIADHGQIATGIQPRYDLRSHTDLVRNLVMQPSGENRLAYLFVRPGCDEGIRQYLENTWPGEFTLVPSAQALAAGLFGAAPAYSRVPDRLGDWVIVPQGNSYLWWADKEDPLKGRHGGLSSQEMLVPFFAMEL